jgi:cytochrome c5
MRVSAVLTAIAVACITLPAGAVDSERYIRFAGGQLEQGRVIWLANCEGCHGYGFAGAPVPMQPSDWLTRIGKDRPVLYEHAINGFFGPDDTMMPERGGNPELTDEQVIAAVDYMVALAEYYIQQER